MSSNEIYVIGGGPGGYVAAIRAAQLGASVTLVEKDRLGGVCLNVGCIPTKCMLHSAELARELKERGVTLGVEAEGVRVNFQQVVKHEKEISEKLSKGVAGLMKENRIRVIAGEAAFTGARALSIKKSDGQTENVKPDAVIIAVGSVNAVPPIPGIKDNPACIDSTGALFLDKLPESLAVIGGGVIGTELACAYAAFGVKVTIIEMLPAILPAMDGELTKIALRRMERMGIQFHLETKVRSVEPDPAGAAVVCTDQAGASLRIPAEKVLVAVGRKANTTSLNLSAGNIDNDRGRIIVNSRMETSVPGVYAIGDCVFGQAQLAHAASAMGETAAENAMGESTAYNPATCPSCVYIEPEFAGVGLTEEQAKAAGVGYIVGKFPMSANGKALILNGGEGMVKIVADKEFGQVIGMHIIGPRAADLISEGALAISLEATLEELIDTIHSHPTVTEAVREAALQGRSRAIHIPNR